MSDPFVRSITFSIAATATTPEVQIMAVEAADGTLQFTIDVIPTSLLTADLRGLFFDFNDDALLASLTATGSAITAFDTTDVINLGGGVNMQGAATPYDAGVAIGTSGIAKDDLQHSFFTLASSLRALSLDDIAGVDFGVRLTSVGAPDGSRTDSAKLVTTATAAPDANQDTFPIYEDGQAGLDHPATTASPLLFQVLANDSDADSDLLLITAIDTPGHGTLAIVDGDDADLLPGDALQYTPTADYAGADQFRYAISDGHGGTDFAWVYVNIAAVADVPTISYTIEAGATINQIIVHVSSSVHDVDGSEYIDRYEFSGLPDGVQLTAIGLNPGDETGTLVRDFVLTLPDEQDWNVDFTVTAIAKETSNGDEESASVVVPIAYSYADTDQSLNFLASDRSIWGEGASGNFSGGDEQSDTASFNADLSALDGIISFSADGSATAGIRYELALAHGTVDANLDYDLHVEARYNQSTDQLLISSNAGLVGGDFSTAAMDGQLNIDVLFAWHLFAQFGYDLTEYLLGVQGTETLANINGALDIPLFGVTSANPALPIETTDVLGNQLSVFWPADGSDAGLMSGDGLLSSIVDGTEFAEIRFDIDQFLTLVAGFPNMVIPIVFDPILNAQIDLLDLGLEFDLDFNQAFQLQALGLDADIVFEDGSSFDFVFGQDFSIADASAIDAAGLDAPLKDNGAVDFMIVLAPDAEFSNTTTMDMDLAFPFDVLKLSGSWDLGLIGSGTFNLAAFHDDLTVDIPPGTLFDDSFALEFIGQDFALSV